ncbi:MAG: peptidyl-prolyl cis-trans isomerase [Deltaproteobacteria bacterium]|nr:peptidyl-prolyl cis-trans isomerase [Deltaproteobacteria bacterium]
MSQSAWADVSHPRVRLETNLGAIVLELDAQKAPKTVENFLAYVRDGFYDGTTFHRVIKGFMIQGGGLTADMQKKPVKAQVKNEADNGLKNKRGTIAMARTGDPNSATAQFFINTVDNAPLDHREKSQPGWGYCVFGKVVEGMGVVDAIEGVKTESKTGRRNVPTTPVVIKQATVME